MFRGFEIELKREEGKDLLKISNKMLSGKLRVHDLYELSTIEEVNMSVREEKK